MATLRIAREPVKAQAVARLLLGARRQVNRGVGECGTPLRDPPIVAAIGSIDPVRLSRSAELAMKGRQ